MATRSKTSIYQKAPTRHVKTPVRDAKTQYRDAQSPWTAPESVKTMDMTKLGKDVSGNNKEYSLNVRLPKKPEWDSHLTDPDRYKLTKEELVLKRQSLISKHNILTSPRSTSSKGKSKAKKQSPFAKQEQTDSDMDHENHRRHADDAISHDKDYSIYDKISSLDLLQTPLNARPTQDKSHSTGRTDEEELTPEDRQEKPVHTNSHKKQLFSATSSHAARSNSNERHNPFNRIANSSPVTFRDRDSSVGRRIPKTPNPITPAASNASARKNIVSASTRDIHSSGYKVSIPSSQVKDNDFISNHDEEIQEMVMQISNLYGEMKYFEELSGRKSALIPQESADTFNSLELSSESSMKTIMRFLIQMVSQTLSYLLKAEIDKNRNDKDYEHLSDRMDELFRLIQSSDMKTTPSNGEISNKKGPGISLMSSASRLTSNEVANESILPRTPARESVPLVSNDVLSTTKRASPYLHPNISSTPQINAKNHVSYATIPPPPPPLDDSNITTRWPQSGMNGTSTSDWLHAFDTSSSDINTMPSQYPLKSYSRVPAMNDSQESFDRNDSSYVDEDTLRLYQYLSKNGTLFDHKNSSDDHHNETKLSQTSIQSSKSVHFSDLKHEDSSIYGYNNVANQSHHTQQNHPIESQKLVINPSNQFSTHQSSDMGSNDVFDDLVRRLTYSSMMMSPPVPLNKDHEKMALLNPSEAYNANKSSAFSASGDNKSTERNIAISPSSAHNIDKNPIPDGNNARNLKTTIANTERNQETSALMSDFEPPSMVYARDTIPQPAAPSQHPFQATPRIIRGFISQTDKTGRR